jgi:hypothetical protein
VLSYTARGFYNSCGSPASRVSDPSLSDPDACTHRGWIRLADARYEARDTQYLASLLADEGLVIPDKVGVTGFSYGGGQSMILAALKNRIMLPDGTLTPWKSPGGLDMAIGAAAPLIPWSDLAASLVPNGRTLDYLVLNPYGLRGGVQKQSWVNALYAIGQAVGFYAPAGADPEADLTAWKARLDAGEPYDTDPSLQMIVTEVTSHHSAYYIDDSTPPAPLFIYNAFTDDLFPADEALRFWRKTVSKHPGAEIQLMFADFFGHPRASLGGSMVQIQAAVTQHFARHLKGSGDPPLPALQTYTQGCNGSSVMGAFTAPDWDAIHPGEVRLDDATPKTFNSAGGSSANASAVDPVGGGATSCRTVTSSADDPGAATYRLPVVTGGGYTLMGSPTVIADLTVTGAFAQVAGRLWDVAPSGSQTLVAQSLYRPRTDNRGPQVFQLHANGWHFAAGHVPKLELLGQSSPYGRPSNGTFTVTASNVELRLPTLEPPGGVIQPPSPPVQPLPDAEPPVCNPSPMTTGCRAPAVAHKSRVLIKTGGDGRLGWKWNKGAATKADFGNPLATTSYSLCVYDGNSTLIMSTSAPADGTCAGKPCWTTTKKGFKYSDPELTPAGTKQLTLKEGAPDKAKLGLKGRGSNLALPALPIHTLPVTVQLLNTNGTCWTTTFSSAQKNETTAFKATSD